MGRDIDELREDLHGIINEAERKQTPTVLKHTVRKLTQKMGGDVGRAFAMGIASLRKAGVLKKAGIELTAKGKKKEAEHEAEPEAAEKVGEYEAQLAAARKKRAAEQRESDMTEAARSISEIATEIKKDWKKVHYAAVPYLDAMMSLDKISDMYGADSARSVVSYFLSNASSWKGEVAKKIKAELKALLKGKAEGIDEDEDIDEQSPKAHAAAAEARRIAAKVQARMARLLKKKQEDLDESDIEEAKRLMVVICPKCGEETATKGLKLRNVEEGPQGEDIAEFDCPECKAKVKATVRPAKYEDAEPVAEADDDAGVADTILKQMGGMGRLKAMLGAKFIKIPKGVAIKWPNKERTKGNYVEVILRPDDTYDMTFFNATGASKKEVKKYEGIYFDQLIELFEKQTGWYLRMSAEPDANAELFDESDMDEATRAELEKKYGLAPKSTGGSLGYKCLECGKKFKTVKAAQAAVNNGCPKCGGSDIDIDTGKDESWAEEAWSDYEGVEEASGLKAKKIPPIGGTPAWVVLRGEEEIGVITKAKSTKSWVAPYKASKYVKTATGRETQLVGSFYDDKDAKKMTAKPGEPPIQGGGMDAALKAIGDAVGLGEEDHDMSNLPKKPASRLGYQSEGLPPVPAEVRRVSSEADEASKEADDNDKSTHFPGRPGMRWHSSAKQAHLRAAKAAQGYDELVKYHEDWAAYHDAMLKLKYPSIYNPVKSWHRGGPEEYAPLTKEDLDLIDDILSEEELEEVWSELEEQERQRGMHPAVRAKSKAAHALSKAAEAEGPGPERARLSARAKEMHGDAAELAKKHGHERLSAHHTAMAAVGKASLAKYHRTFSPHVKKGESVEQFVLSDEELEEIYEQERAPSREGSPAWVQASRAASKKHKEYKKAQGEYMKGKSPDSAKGQEMHRARLAARHAHTLAKDAAEKAGKKKVVAHHHAQMMTTSREYAGREMAERGSGYSIRRLTDQLRGVLGK